MQYILSYCSCSRPCLLCALSLVWGRRGAGGREARPVGRPPSPSLCSLSETSGGSWNFVFGGLCKKMGKKLCRVHLLFRCFLSVCKTSFGFVPFGFLTLLSFSLCYCFLLLCSLIQTSLSLSFLSETKRFYN